MGATQILIAIAGGLIILRLGLGFLRALAAEYTDELRETRRSSTGKPLLALAVDTQTTVVLFLRSLMRTVNLLDPWIYGFR